MNPRRIYLAVAACAVVVYIGSLFNAFALDDAAIILFNPLMRSASGLWQSFVVPYWPADFGGKMYRPLPLATFVADALVKSPTWFHAVNILWHAGASIAVAALAWRLAGERVAIAAGLLFAAHPVHVEAVANVVGRAELMAALFAVLCVYAALVRRQPLWSALALAAGLLSKENAAVAPALVAWGWLLGIDRPPRRHMLAMAGGWLLVALVYGAARWAVLHPFARFEATAPVFAGLSFVDVRLTAFAAFVDVARLLVFPAVLRVEYTPLERTAVTTPLHGGFLLGLVLVLGWVMLTLVAWRRGGRVEAFGLGWIGIAYLPVANLLYPSGVFVAERTLYLPSVGFVIALGALAARLKPQTFVLAVGSLTLVGGVRSALRVPVWKDDASVTLSILQDSPASYRGPARGGAIYQNARRPAAALDAYRAALRIFPDASVYVAAADAAFTLDQPTVADSMLEGANRLCFRCSGALRVQARSARGRGHVNPADSHEARAARQDVP
jgi:hypothetical protein